MDIGLDNVTRTVKVGGPAERRGCKSAITARDPATVRPEAVLSGGNMPHWSFPHWDTRTGQNIRVTRRRFPRAGSSCRFQTLRDFSPWVKRGCGHKGFP